LVSAEGSDSEYTAYLEVIDFSDPADIEWSSTVVGGTGLGHTGLLAVGSTVYTSHWHAVDGDPTRVRFYVDRFDVSSPEAPVALPSVNVPGSLLSYDAATGLAVTVDYTAYEEEMPNYGDCRATHPDTGYSNYQTERCAWIGRDLRLVQLASRGVELLDTRHLDDAGWVSGVALGDARVFLIRYVGGYSCGYTTDHSPLQLHATVVSVNDKQLRVATTTRELDDPHFCGGGLVAQGTRAVFGFELNQLGLVDASDPASPTVKMLGSFPGYIYDVSISRGRALCSLDSYGMAVIELP
jgi:hypothetical protein